MLKLLDVIEDRIDTNVLENRDPYVEACEVMCRAEAARAGLR